MNWQPKPTGLKSGDLSGFVTRMNKIDKPVINQVFIAGFSF